jgi:hypothetical protein
MKTIIKIIKRILAIVAAPAAIPPKPNTAAIIATIKKIKAHHNILFSSQRSIYMDTLGVRDSHGLPILNILRLR